MKGESLPQKCSFLLLLFCLSELMSRRRCLPCPLDRERRDIAGDKPPDLFGFCGANVRGTFYIFAGCNNNGYTNQVLLQTCVLAYLGGGGGCAQCKHTSFLNQFLKRPEFHLPSARLESIFDVLHSLEAVCVGGEGGKKMQSAQLAPVSA